MCSKLWKKIINFIPVCGLSQHQFSSSSLEWSVKGCHTILRSTGFLVLEFWKLLEEIIFTEMRGQDTDVTTITGFIVFGWHYQTSEWLEFKMSRKVPGSDYYMGQYKKLLWPNFVLGNTVLKKEIYFITCWDHKSKPPSSHFVNYASNIVLLRYEFKVRFQDFKSREDKYFLFTAPFLTIFKRLKEICKWNLLKFSVTLS